MITDLSKNQRTCRLEVSSFDYLMENECYFEQIQQHAIEFNK